ncbi:maestro heat-like repeat-containing protein family member 7 [Haliaeetus albicilla]|uniref:maestro heat-like repeat-containing protein family member 7 n=1 Tax=Haliaeetus albicilla TaxID=8969 RepID=UPI0037E7788B
MWGEGPGDFQAARATENHRTPLRRRALHRTTLSSPGGSARPAVAKPGQASPEPRHKVPPCPVGNTISAPSCLPRRGPRHSSEGAENGQGCRTSLGPAALARAQCGGQGSPADRVLWACSAALAMWDVMLSQTHTLEKVLRELLSKLQDQQLRRVFGSSTEDACIHHLALLASSDMKSEEFAGLYNVHRYLRRPSLALLSLALRGLVTLSQRPETARKILVLLPDIMETQQNASSDNKMKALLVFRNVMGHMKRKEASPTALQLVDKLPPLFDDQSSQLRELSICLFKDAMQTVVGNDKQQMRKNVRRSLLPLFFHMSDQTESVAKASREALLVAAKLLKWKRLKHLTRTQQTGRIGECLLVQDRSRVEEYLSQSLPYLKDAQVTLREAALKFIGLAARHLGDESEEKLSEICNALQLLEKDAELSVSSLAAQTMLTLRSPREQPTSGWTLWALCCWSCKAGQK